MRIFNILKNDYIRLFIKRESRVVLGNKNSTLWLLTIVLTVTFLAIAFSNASLSYLSYKMDDPFINWVDIKNDSGSTEFINLETVLDNDDNKEKYHYYGYQYDYYFSVQFFGDNDEKSDFMKCRFFQTLNTPLVEAILSDDNVVNNWRIADLSALDANSIGTIITEEALLKLGYTKAPTYIDLKYGSTGLVAENVVEYGYDVYSAESDEGSYFRVPVPVLAVVKRLPGNVDLISTAYLYCQWTNDNSYPFQFGQHPEYAENICYFVPADFNAEHLQTTVDAIASEYSVELVCDNFSFWKPEIIPFREGNFVIIDIDGYGDLSFQDWADINRRILKEHGKKGLYRVYDYDFKRYDLTRKAYLSVHFRDLDKLGDFEKYVREEFDVKIDMTQINAKENFNDVSTMGNILSALIIVFAIICIILFIVNLLRSYFQKIKRNLGTFKAFGISNRDLISVYVLIMAGIIITAILLSVSATWFIQGALQICGIVKDVNFGYLSLWSLKTVCSILVIIISSIFTVYRVMNSLLKATPGDLIYDRQ